MGYAKQTKKTIKITGRKSNSGKKIKVRRKGR